MKIPVDWTFRSSDVAESFDAHVREQLPWYDLATGALAHLVRHYLPEEGVLVDVGASTGNVGRAVADVLVSRRAGLISVEPSAEMREVFRGPEGVRLIDLSDARTLANATPWGPAWQVLRQDRAEDFPFSDAPPPDVVVMFLALSFVPVRARRALTLRAWNAIRPGGILIILDKATPPCGYFGQVLRRLTLAGKVAAGATASDVVAKELSLGGIQRPVDPHVDLPFAPRDGEWFRFGEFVGWCTEKEDR